MCTLPHTRGEQGLCKNVSCTRIHGAKDKAPCVVCMEDVATCGALLCPHGHVLCGDCGSQYLSQCTDSNLMLSQKQQVVSDGFRCPVPVRSSRRVRKRFHRKLSADNATAQECSAPFDDRDVKRHVSSEAFRGYISCKKYVAEQVAIEKKERAQLRQIAKLKASQAKDRMTKRVQQEQLQRWARNQNARMCGKCKYGPVEHMACNDLAAHNGQSSGRGTSSWRSSRWPLGPSRWRSRSRRRCRGLHSSVATTG
eukprot:COSAG06_NODE_3671_length_5036_cov_3.267977_8_plen_253_part_00